MAPIICQNISHGERGSFQTADETWYLSCLDRQIILVMSVQSLTFYGVN